MQHCADIPHQVFLHQAVLSALLVRDIPNNALRILPPEYSYPLHLHARVPTEKQPRAIEELTTPVYEEEFLYTESLVGFHQGQAIEIWFKETAAEFSRL